MLFILGIMCVVMALLGATTALTIQGGGKAGAVDLVIGKIGLNHLIIASSVRLFPLQWPEFVTTFFTAMTIASASAMGDSGLSTDCVSKEMGIGGAFC